MYFQLYFSLDLSVCPNSQRLFFSQSLPLYRADSISQKKNVNPITATDLIEKKRDPPHPRSEPSIFQDSLSIRCQHKPAEVPAFLKTRSSKAGVSCGDLELNVGICVVQYGEKRKRRREKGSYINERASWVAEALGVGLGMWLVEKKYPAQPAAMYIGRHWHIEYVSTCLLQYQVCS
ncbi:hypothetical protein BGX38DRAFT_1186460 [Terfezia claveryi]|nr:hypothetical protein BGX38DRAFT_1186460 [Terfezia claveryi]